MTAAVEGGDVTIEKNVRYLPHGRAETLDLYLRRRPQDQREAAWHRDHPWRRLDWWRQGGKGEINIGTTLASHGYVCVSINYALAAEGRPTWPGNLQDCKRAVRGSARMPRSTGSIPTTSEPSAGRPAGT